MKKYLDFKHKFNSDCLANGRDPSVYAQIISHVLNCTYNQVFFSLSKEIEPDKLEQMEAIASRYLAGEPIQYILGYTYFHHLKLEVNKDVLIPRFETEELVAKVLKQHGEAYLKVLDIGTGSGCIAAAIKENRPTWQVSASDISKAALEVAKKNFKNLNLDINTYLSDFLKDIKDDFDIIISNPPYISPYDNEVDKEVFDNEPHLALFTSDEEGIEAYKTILTQLKDRDFQEIYFEFGYQQKEALIGLLKFLNYTHYEFYQDISRHDRILRVYKS